MNERSYKPTCEQLGTLVTELRVQNRMLGQRVELFEAQASLPSAGFPPVAAADESQAGGGT